MKKSNLLIGFILLTQFATLSAHAAVVDVWQLKSGDVKPSVATKADGTVLTADPSQEVLLTLGLQTTASYGSHHQRDVKIKQVIPATSNEPAVIKIEIESDSEKQCRTRGGGMIVGSYSPAVAKVNVVVKPGDYILVVDNLVFGLLSVSQTEVLAAAANNYVAEASENAAARAAKIFGDLDGKKIIGDRCSVLLKKVGNDLTVEYSFPSYQENLPNGDILIHKEVRGSSKITNDFASASSCSKNTVTWERTLRGENNVAIKINAGEYLDFGFTVEGAYGERKYCR